MNFEFIGNCLQRVQQFKHNGYRLIEISLQIKAKFTTFKSISARKNSRYETLLKPDSNVVLCKS